MSKDKKSKTQLSKISDGRCQSKKKSKDKTINYSAVSYKSADDGLSLEKPENCTSRKRPRENHKNNVKVTTSSLKDASSGIAEIDDLFDDKKQKDTVKKQKKEEEEKICKISKMQKSSSLKEGNVKNKSLKYDRTDIVDLKSNDWVNDGLGGIFNKDGYTGRREETSGYKVYKAHLFNKKGFGETKDCPFDCQCCFI